MLSHTHIAGAAALCAGVALATGAPQDELLPILLLGAAGGIFPDGETLHLCVKRTRVSVTMT